MEGRLYWKTLLFVKKSMVKAEMNEFYTYCVKPHAFLSYDKIQSDAEKRWIANSNGKSRTFSIVSGLSS